MRNERARLLVRYAESGTRDDREEGDSEPVNHATTILCGSNGTITRSLESAWRMDMRTPLDGRRWGRAEAFSLTRLSALENYSPSTSERCNQLSSRLRQAAAAGKLTARQGEDELRALPFRTEHNEVAMHGAREIAADREPQPGALRRARQAPVQLNKWL